MKKILSFIMALIITLGSFTFSKEAVLASDEIAIQSRNMPYAGYFIYGSTETQPLRTKIDYYTDKSGAERMAYCIEPTKNGVCSYDEVTDAKGIARFEGLKSGIVYRVKEVVPPKHYILDSTCENIILNAGQLQKITIKNKKKPSLTILKYDELTSKPLDGAEFSVAKKGGQIIWAGIVSNGEMILEDLPKGWLTVTELAAPKGYLKRDENKDVYLEKGGAVTVKFDNRLKPSLQILKVDNNLKPLEGVKYKVAKLEDKTVSEYFTDAMGQIIIYDLDEAIYKVEQLSTLDTHIFDTKPKEIQL